MAGIHELIDGLNPPQREAVEHRGGPLLVLAGAGSGKTRVVATRIAHLVAGGERADRILALTFTNKAAREMRERVSPLVGGKGAGGLTVCTFHRLGLSILHEEAKTAGLRRPFTLLDAGDQAMAVRHCLKAMGVDPRRHDPQGILMLISRARNADLGPDEVARQQGGSMVADALVAYLEWMEAHEAVDFDDLILKPVTLLRRHPELREKWQERYRHVLVDEYQDTNAMQLELVRLLSQEHRNLMVVGDDDQSIYGWRGACRDNILHFEQHFPDARTIALEQNYRSTGAILASANALITHNTSRKPKLLWTDHDLGEKVRSVCCRDPESEAAYVASELLAHRRDGTRWSQMGVLFRAGAQAKALEESLRLGGIPYRLVGAYQFFERKEIKDVLSYLRLLINPRDRTSFVRVVNFPQRGVGPKRLSALMAFARARSLSPFAACARAREIPDLGREPAQALVDFFEGVERCRRQYERWKDHREGSLRRVVATMCEEVGARSAWIRDTTEGPGGEARWRAVQSLMTGMEAWEKKNPTRDLEDYLHMVAMEGRQDTEEDHQERVALMTIHSAKGLEWPVCMVVGCQEGSLPHSRSLEDGSVDEERRLFYVAITRARRALYLTRSMIRRSYGGAKEPARQSRFLTEIPPEFLEEIDRSEGGGDLDKKETSKRFSDLLDSLD